MNVSSGPPSQVDLLRWAEALAASAMTGIGFTESLYERERYEEILHVAGEIRARSDALSGRTVDSTDLVSEWYDGIGQGVKGYVTPKVTVGAVVGNDAGEMLLVQRSGSGVWLYPTGWADVGYSPAEVVIKEVLEETGIECEVVRPIAILDGLRLGITSIPLYSLVFHCRMKGGKLKAHPLECLDVGFFAEDSLPEGHALPLEWVSEAFAALRGETMEVRYDRPRDPLWEGDTTLQGDLGIG
ncbi:MAG: NUDIX hydrolase N-terminal domain-containing protein [Acidimicrobiales bacterium]|nr:NUDIX hydrolase N-terminal domain-containing protein [Acidimicrobiales bacterium]